MKKNKHISIANCFLGIWAGIFLLVVIGALAIFHSSNPLIHRDQKRVTFVAPMANSMYWGDAAMGAINAAKECGINVKCVSSYTADREKTISNLKSAIYSGAEGIITYGMDDSEEFDHVLDLAEEKDIPVVLIDSDIAEDKRLCYIGTDNKQAGREAGEQMAESLNGKGNIVMVISYLDDPNQKARMDGFCSVIDQYPDMQITDILEDELSFHQARRMFSEKLEEYSEIDGVFCAEGTGSGAICQMLKNEKTADRDMTVVTFELTKETYNEIEDGRVHATIRQDSYSMGKRAIEAIDAYIDGQVIPETLIHTDTFVINQENLKDNFENVSRSVDVLWHVY